MGWLSRPLDLARAAGGTVVGRSCGGHRFKIRRRGDAASLHDAISHSGSRPSGWRGVRAAPVGHMSGAARVTDLISDCRCSAQVSLAATPGPAWRGLAQRHDRQGSYPPTQIGGMSNCSAQRAIARRRGGE